MALYTRNLSVRTQDGIVHPLGNITRDDSSLPWVINEVFFSPTGDDTNIGSQAEPKQSIQAYIDNGHNEGDGLVLLDGIYNQNIYIDVNQGGTVSAPLTIYSHSRNKDAVEIRASDLTASTVWFSGCQNVHFANIHVSGQLSKTSGDNAPLKTSARNNYGSLPTNITVSDCEFSGTGKDMVKFVFVINGNFLRNTIAGDAGQELLDLFGTRDSLIEGNLFTGEALFSAITEKGGCLNNQIYDNTFSSIHGNVSYILLGGSGVSDEMADVNYPTVLLHGASCRNTHLRGNIYNGDSTNAVETIRMRGVSGVLIENETKNLIGSNDYQVSAGSHPQDGFVTSDTVIRNVLSNSKSELFQNGIVPSGVTVTELNLGILPTNIVYVSPEGNDAYNGGEITKPKQTISAALQAANDASGSIVTVLLADGSYSGAVTFPQSTKSITLKSSTPKAATVVFNGGIGLDTNGASNIVIEDINFEGICTIGFNLSGGDNIRIRKNNVNLITSVVDGLFVGSSNCTVMNNIMKGEGLLSHFDFREVITNIIFEGNIYQKAWLFERNTETGSTYVRDEVHDQGNFGEPTVSVLDARAPVDAAYVDVSLQLSFKPNACVQVFVSTENGSAWADANDVTRGMYQQLNLKRVFWWPGDELIKNVRISLNPNNLSSGASRAELDQDFRLFIRPDYISQASIERGTGTITFSNEPYTPLVETNQPAPSLPNLGTQSYQLDIANIQANTDGFDNDGNPILRTAPNYGADAKTQGGNNEVGIYEEDKWSRNNDNTEVYLESSERAPEDHIPVDWGTITHNASMLTSANTFAQKYGFWEITAKMPTAVGAWAAFWMIPTPNYKWPPEIDVLEMPNNPNYLADQMHTAIHFGNQTQPGRRQKTALRTFLNETVSPTFNKFTEFHTYAVHWDENYITWFVDGIAVNRYPTLAFVEMHWLMNVAVGGVFANTVDYSRSIDPANAPDVTTAMVVRELNVYELAA